MGLGRYDFFLVFVIRTVCIIESNLIHKYINLVHIVVYVIFLVRVLYEHSQMLQRYSIKL